MGNNIEISSAILDLSDEQVAPNEVVATVQDVKLPEPVANIADKYAKMIGVRDRYLWKWIYSLLPAYRLSSVSEREREYVRQEKTLLTIFVTVLDDIAEQRQDMETFHEARRCVTPGDRMDPQRPSVDTDTLHFLQRVWDQFKDGLTSAPCYSERIAMFRYDLRQTLNAIDYSWLVTTMPEVATLSGSQHYAPHNMMLFSYVNVDLIHSVGFEPSDLGNLRELVWELQRLARIGNWVSTWEREIREGDYSSGVILRALDRGVINRNDLADPDTTSESIIKRVRNANIEEELLDEWERIYTNILADSYSIDSVDVEDFITGLRTVLSYQVGSEGYK